MNTRNWIFILAVGVIISGAIGYTAGLRTSNARTAALIRSMTIVHSAKETVYYTRLLEALREGKTDPVIDRLETMLDHSIINIGIETEFTGPLEDVDEALSRSLRVAQDYRARHPHRPTDDWSAKRYDAALALTSEHN